MSLRFDVEKRDPRPPMRWSGILFVSVWAIVGAKGVVFWSRLTREEGVGNGGRKMGRRRANDDHSLSCETAGFFRDHLSANERPL